MATLKTTKTLKGDQFMLKIETLSWSANDLALIKAYGEPTIDVGGTFAYGEAQSFKLPSCNKMIVSDFPVMQVFDGTAFGDAQLRANAWATTIATRLGDAVTALRDLADTFSSVTSTSL